MPSVVSLERRDPSGGRRRVVEGELGHGQELVPIVLIVGAIGTEDVLEGAIGAFRLTVCLRMIRR